ncbi:MAG TPA: LpxD N-terminal domain-containing protein, partial [Pyrinomonadaceae bacterium]|nr:LpxD N-terminal domain-containing protein [Pyrinomonadaceae bacterium]
MKLSELARQTGAQIEGGSPELEIEGAAGLDEAAPGHVTFLANPRYTPRLQTTRASAVYVAEGVEVGRTDIAVLRAPDPYLAYTRALRLFNPEPEFEPVIHPTAVVDPSARLGAGVAVGACAVIGARAVIGDRVRIHPNVTVYDGVEVGDDAVLHSG